MADDEGGWTVAFHAQFVPEFRALDGHVKVELGALLDKLRDKAQRWAGHTRTR